MNEIKSLPIWVTLCSGLSLSLLQKLILQVMVSPYNLSIVNEHFSEFYFSHFSEIYGIIFNVCACFLKAAPLSHIFWAELQLW